MKLGLIDRADCAWCRCTISIASYSYGSPFPMLFLRFAARRIAGEHGSPTHRRPPLKRDVFYICQPYLVDRYPLLSRAQAARPLSLSMGVGAKCRSVGWLSRLNRTVFVKRENRHGRRRSKSTILREALDDNWSVTDLPRRHGDRWPVAAAVQDFSMMSVLEPPPKDVLVQPIVLDYGDVAEELGWIGEESGDQQCQAGAERARVPSRTSYSISSSPSAPRSIAAGKPSAPRARRRPSRTSLADEVLGKPLRDYQAIPCDTGALYAAPKDQITGTGGSPCLAIPPKARQRSV